jgi:predicted outer membrane repeat protein
MEGEEVSGNKATTYGGGVYVSRTAVSGSWD